ncbi:MAG: hypothetical protein ACLP9L_30145 [Thermoguttaceae bacterium]
MKTFVKLSIVLAAYVVAFVVAAGVVHLRELRPQWRATAQASPGMAAFADFILFVEVFGVAAAVPTALAGCFLRPCRRICTVFATGCLALAATGLIAAVVVVWTRSLHAEIGLLRTVAIAGELRTILSPILAPSFLVSVPLAPTWRCRWILLAAAAMEGAASASGHAWLL